MMSDSLTALRLRYRDVADTLLRSASRSRAYDARAWRVAKTLFNDGIKAVAILGDVKRFRPFFESARDAASFAIASNAFGDLGLTDAQRLYERADVYFVYFACERLLNAGAEKEWQAYEEATRSFDSMLALEWQAVRRSSSDFDVSVALVKGLAFDVLSTNWRLSSMTENAVSEGCRTLPVHHALQELRTALSGVDWNDASSISTYERAFRRVVAPDRFDTGTISGLLPLDCYLLSLVGKEGDISSALIEMFR